MSTGIINIIKQAAQDVVNNSQMCDLRFGKVVSVSPLKVQVTHQFTIPEKLLIVPEHLTTYQVDVTMLWETEESEDHKHQIESNKSKKLIIHNELKVGDKVALLRATGGQTYYILDRI